ncbi:hypothetical protein LSH36_559g01010 [Paralvinella palmiformis]|uniref:BZIP domain-containing protein n=1 Tax=Paralvinella palmiformis TaxID=53620 RepID=A0AAD9MXF6_9ANNE|nr:hypothetical protein LSH36_559g01010 [Paralvinella palmiformis]
MRIEDAYPTAYFRSVYETMATQTAHQSSPTPDQVSSAADAMLSLSAATSSDSGDVVIRRPRSTGQARSESGTSATTPTGGLGVALNDDDSQSSLVGSRQSRKQREFIPEDLKDESYWIKRRKNNEAAKKSREKRRVNDLVLNQRIAELTNKNTRLEFELKSIKRRFGWPADKPFPLDAEMATMTVTAARNDYLSNSDSESSSNTSFNSGMFAPSRTNPGAAVGCTVTDGAPTTNTTSAALKSPGLRAGKSTSRSSSSPPPALPHREHEMPDSVAQEMPMLLPLVPPHVAGLIPANIPVCLPHPVIEGGMPCVREESSSIDDSQPPPPLPLQVFSNGAFPYPLNSYDGPGDGEPGVLCHRSRSPSYSTSSSPERVRRATTNSGCELDPFGADVSNIRRDLPLSARRRSSSQSEELPHYSVDFAKVVENSRGSGRKGVPFKLWHKISSSGENYKDPEMPTPSSQMTVDEEDRTATEQVTSTSSDRVKVGKTNQYIDPRYMERRKRNNIAARKCRENRKLLNDIRLQKATILETENSRLRDEMKELTTEISSLRDLLERKKMAQAKGETFELPPADDIGRNDRETEPSSQ